MIVAASVLMPFAASAANAAALQSTLGVANVTAGNSGYHDSVKAKAGQTIKLQLHYQRAKPGAGGSVKKVNVRFAIPTKQGGTQTVMSTLQASDGKTSKQKATVHLANAGGHLSYVPGSAVWRHNSGSERSPSLTNTGLSDAITSAKGVQLSIDHPKQKLAATVTVLVRVAGKGTSMDTQVQTAGQSGKWADNNKTKPGGTIQYLITYKNTGSSTAKNVVVRDKLPDNASLVKGSTHLRNASNSHGTKLSSNAVASKGVNIGNYASGANAYVSFKTKVASASKLSCGTNTLKDTGIVTVASGGQHSASATTKVTRKCDSSSGSSSQNPKPSYSCNTLKVSKLGHRKIKASVDYTAKHGAKLKTITYDFGEASGQPLTTDKTTVTHTYKKPGGYTVTASLLVQVGGHNKTIKSQQCAQTVHFAAQSGDKPSAPSSPHSKNGKIPNTGPGDVIGLFAASTLAGIIGYRVFLSRRFAR
jgi:uncharacterized repeat protein (TIGR01451 family)